MLSFTPQEISLIQQKAQNNSAYLEGILHRHNDLLNHLYIQKTAIATWPHYFICPKCSVKLIYDYHNPDEYACPLCNNKYSGEPYLGGWWSETAYKNAEGAFELAVMYLITQDKKALQCVKDILLGYAQHYESYDVHGGIPYNNPGKMFAQVLDDSAALNSLTRAYDLISNELSDDEQHQIIHGLFLPGACHLMKNMTPQLHNHEVCICSALGNIGLVTQNQDILDFALNQKYGIKYQIEHGFLEDAMWFEGSMGYHLYTLNWIMRYETLARHTKYSLFKDEYYRKKLYLALTLASKLVLKDGTFPKINDSEASFKDKESIYELAYTIFNDDAIAFCLNQVAKFSHRNDLYSLLYGKELPEIHLSKQNYLSKTGSQLALIHGSNERTFLFKASPYGGEHDHYDRLSISFSAFGKDVCTDLGTASGYSAPLHYAYFKNTATHNTVVINGENMAPAETVIHEYRETAENDIYLDASTLWSKDFIMPDSFTIKQWNEKCYEGAFMHRKIQWCDHYFIDVFHVESNNTLAKDWTLHIDGNLATDLNQTQKMDTLSSSTPHSHFHSIMKINENVKKLTYDCGEFNLHIHPMMKEKELIFAKGPANPATRDLSYLIERTVAERCTFVNVIETCRKDDECIEDVEFIQHEDIIEITITFKDKTKKNYRI